MRSNLVLRPLVNVTAIHLAALYGFIEVVKKLSKKYDDPMVNGKMLEILVNGKEIKGGNSIHLAAFVKYLMGFTDAPLAPDDGGWTPIHYVAINGNMDTVKFLVGLTDTPNAPNILGNTPIEIAKIGKNVEVQKFLEDYCK